MEPWIHTFINKYCADGPILISPTFISPEHLYVAYKNSDLDINAMPEMVRYIVLLRTEKIYRVEKSPEIDKPPVFICVTPDKVARYKGTQISRLEYDDRKDDLLYEALSELAMRYLNEKKECTYQELRDHLFYHEKKWGFTDEDFRGYMQTKYSFVRMGIDKCYITDTPARTMIKYDMTIQDNSSTIPEWTMCLKDGVWYVISRGAVSSIDKSHLPILQKILDNKKVSEIISPEP